MSYKLMSKVPGDNTANLDDVLKTQASVQYPNLKPKQTQSKTQ